MMSARIGALVLALAAWGASLSVAAPSASFVYEHNLADFSGPIPFLGVRVRLDVPHDEAYVLQGGFVRVFGPTGMEVHSFTLDPAVGMFADVAVLESGEIYLLGYRPDAPLDGTGFFLLRCDFRGEPLEKVEITGLPEALRDFAPDTLVYSGGRFYVASSSRLAVAVLEPSGKVVTSADLGQLAALEPELRAEAQFGGFAVTPDGRLVFSLPTDFSVRIVSLDGSVSARVGEAGSKAGQFGIVGAVATDADGTLYVADKLRHVVIVFDRNLGYVGEIGGYGVQAGRLVVPTHVAVTPGGTLFVSQMRSRGVSVYRRTAEGGRG